MLLLNDLFSSGRIADVIIALTVIEALALIVYYRITGRGVATRDFLGNLISGIFLLLALRAALSGANWALIALCLLASFAAHLTDLALRWR